MHCARITLDVVQRSQYFQGLCDFHLSWINRQEKHTFSSVQILTSRYQSIVDNRMKIECASNMMNVREYSSSNQHIVLLRRINEIASRMSLKSTEVDDCSQNVRAILISSFGSSSCSQTNFPSCLFVEFALLVDLQEFLCCLQ